MKVASLPSVQQFRTARGWTSQVTPPEPQPASPSPRHTPHRPQPDGLQIPHCRQHHSRALPIHIHRPVREHIETVQTSQSNGHSARSYVEHCSSLNWKLRRTFRTTQGGPKWADRAADLGARPPCLWRSAAVTPKRPSAGADSGDPRSAEDRQSPRVRDVDGPPAGELDATGKA
jgi:hypothetical protein